MQLPTRLCFLHRGQFHHKNKCSVYCRIGGHLIFHLGCTNYFDPFLKSGQSHLMVRQHKQTPWRSSHIFQAEVETFGQEKESQNVLPENEGMSIQPTSGAKQGLQEKMVQSCFSVQFYSDCSVVNVEQGGKNELHTALTCLCVWVAFNRDFWGPHAACDFVVNASLLISFTAGFLFWGLTTVNGRSGRENMSRYSSRHILVGG